jgi:hypothetical protein
MILVRSGRETFFEFDPCVRIFKQSMGARPGKEPSRNRVVVPARLATQPGGIGSLESILGHLKS